MNIFYLIGAFQGVFLSVIILSRVRSTANLLLATLLCLFSFYLFEQAIYVAGKIPSFPHLLYATLTLTFLIGPLFFHFVRFNTVENSDFKWTQLWHLLPFAYEFIILIPFYLLPASKKLIIYDQIQTADGSISFSRFLLGYLIYLIATTYFVSRSYLLLKKAAPKNKQAKRKQLWLTQMSVFFIIYFVANILLSILAWTLPEFTLNFQHASLIILTVIIHVTGYICFVNAEVIIKPFTSSKYENSSLSQSDIDKYCEQLRKLMKEEELFLKEDLTQQDLSIKLGLTNSNLSQVISKGLNTNFYKLVNKYRIERAIELLSSDEYSNVKMIHVAIDSGFNNKTSFLRNFKEMTGCTPTLYKKSSSTKGSVTSKP